MVRVIDCALVERVSDGTVMEVMVKVIVGFFYDCVEVKGIDGLLVKVAVEEEMVMVVD